MLNNRTEAVPFFRTAYPWFICSIGMLFYCFNYFLRVSPSVMQTELSQAFHINAYQFGTLAAFYYYAYTPMQIPAGMIYDKFGVRVVLSFACLVAATGLAVFIHANSFAGAGAGRFLIGLGAAFAYIGTLKLASVWLPANRFATIAGLTSALGMISGALSQKYLVNLVHAIGYKHALGSALMTGIVLSVVIMLIVRNRPKNENLSHVPNELTVAMNKRQLFNALRVIFTNPQMWLIGLIGGLTYLPASVFLDLWGVPYLKSVYQLTAAQAVNVSSFTFIGWIIAGPVIGAISDKIKRRRMPLLISSTIATILLCTVFYVPGISLFELYMMFFCIGFCCGSHSLCFALGKESNPIQIAGTAVAVTNMLIMLGGVIFQPLVGKLLDLHRTGAVVVHGLATYAPADYTFALSVIPIGVGIGILLSLFLKETYCESQESHVSKSKEKVLSRQRPIQLRPDMRSVN